VPRPEAGAHERAPGRGGVPIRSLRRSMVGGYAGIDNELHANAWSGVLFADAKQGLADTTTAPAERSAAVHRSAASGDVARAWHARIPGRVVMGVCATHADSGLAVHSGPPGAVVMHPAHGRRNSPRLACLARTPITHADHRRQALEPGRDVIRDEPLGANEAARRTRLPVPLRFGPWRGIQCRPSFVRPGSPCRTHESAARRVRPGTGPWHRAVPGHRSVPGHLVVPVRRARHASPCRRA
jgi:hypothetical protein